MFLSVLQWVVAGENQLSTALRLRGNEHHLNMYIPEITIDSLEGLRLIMGHSFQTIGAI